MNQVLSGLSYKSHAQEHQEITFGPAHSHAECLKAMASHVLATRTDDDAFNTPDWYRSAPADTRRTLMKRADDSDEGLRFYNAFSLSEAQMPSFAAYLHEQARKRLNQLLGRAGNDVDPDTVWAYSPTALIGTSTPAPSAIPSCTAMAMPTALVFWRRSSRARPASKAQKAWT